MLSLKYTSNVYLKGEFSLNLDERNILIWNYEDHSTKIVCLDKYWVELVCQNIDWGVKLDLSVTYLSNIGSIIVSLS